MSIKEGRKCKRINIFIIKYQYMKVSDDLEQTQQLRAHSGVVVTDLTCINNHVIIIKTTEIRHILTSKASINIMSLKQLEKCCEDSLQYCKMKISHLNSIHPTLGAGAVHNTSIPGFG